MKQVIQIYKNEMKNTVCVRERERERERILEENTLLDQYNVHNDSIYIYIYIYTMRLDLITI